MSDSVAVALLVDSSLPLFQQWPAVLVHYISPLLARLIQNRSTSQQFHIGFVSYGNADLYPSPIVSKRYFTQPQQIHKELREEPQKLGLGVTGTGGKLGMAVLEGYATTLELFDMFLKVSGNERQSEKPEKKIDNNPDSKADDKALIPSPNCHIIHILSSLPDDSRHPQWNQSLELDTLSWDTLPDELRKRNINLNVVLLRSSTQLSELHSQVTPDPCKCWFTVRPGHSVLLSAEASWSPSPAAKRQATEEETTQAKDDAKRPRISSPAKEESPALSTAPPQKSPTVHATPVVPQVQPAPPTTGMPQHNSVPPIIQIVTKVKQLEIQIRQHAAEVATATQAGRTQEAENIKSIMQPKLAMYMKLKQGLTHLQASAQKNNGAAAPNNTNDSDKNASGPGPSNASQNVSAASSTSSTLPDRQAIAQLMQNRFSQPLEKPSVLPQAGNRAAIPPNVALQMQKMLQQRGVQGVQQLMQAQGSSAGPNTQSLAGKPDRSTWIGTVNWASFEALPEPARVIAEVQIQGQHRHDLSESTWPTTINLVPSKTNIVPINDLKAWMARHEPKMFTISGLPRTIPPNVNEANLKSLSRLMEERKVYAVGSWRLPSTQQVSDVMFVFVGPAGALGGLCIPTTGIPELPMPSMHMNLQQALASMPTAQLAGNSLPNHPGMFAGGAVPQQSQQERANLEKIAAMRMAQQRFQSQMQAGGANAVQQNVQNSAWNNDTNVMNNPPMNFGFGINANQQSLGPGLQFPGNANAQMPQTNYNIPGGLQRAPGGPQQNPGTMSNFSIEMLQSFMKRS